MSIVESERSPKGNSTIESYPSVAVIGSGYWGKNLTRNFYRLGALRVICDTDAEIRTAMKKQYPAVETCSDVRDVMNRDDIEAVVIATPAVTHFAVAREALNAGKHIFVEKPFVLDEAEGFELIKLSEAGKLIIMVGHVLQYHPAFIRLKEMVSAGELGRLNYIYSHRLNLGKIRREENILWSFAPHDISIILSLADENPATVLAIGGCYLNKETADVTSTHLEFPSGLMAHIFVSWLHPFKEQKLVVVGEQTMAVFDDTQPWGRKLELYPHEIKFEGTVPVLNRAKPERVTVAEHEPLFVECRHFLECVATGSIPKTDAYEGINVLRILNLSQQSMDNNSKKYYVPKSVNEHGGI